MNKDQGIETLRTIAMFWIVFAHVGGISPGGGLGFYDQPVMQYLMQTIGFFPIPAFVLLSGYLYARKPSNVVTLGADLRKAFMSIVLPALAVGAAFYLIKSVAYGQAADMSVLGFLGSLFYPKTHLWFLYALFWIYIVVMLMDAGGLLARPMSWLMTMVALVLFELAGDLPFNFLSLNKMPYILPFFLMGYGLQRYGDLVWTPLVQRCSLVIGVVLLMVNQWLWFSGNQLDPFQYMVFERMTSWALLPLIFLYRPAIPALAYWGPLTFIIYLFHPFAAGFARVMMYKFTDIQHPALQLALVMTFSILASVLVVKAWVFVLKKLMPARGQAKKSGRKDASYEREALKTG